MNPKRCTRHSRSNAMFNDRCGKVLVALVLTLPTVFAVVAYYIDGCMLLASSQTTQQLADFAATSAAYCSFTESGDPSQAALESVRVENNASQALVTTQSPPGSGRYAGLDGYFQVEVVQPYNGFFLKAAGLTEATSVRATSVAGIEAATSDASIYVLDPDPATISLAPLPVSLPNVTPLLGGLEVIGIGELEAVGAVVVNNEWGGIDEDGNQVGPDLLTRASCHCGLGAPLTSVRVDDLRVVGGVDDLSNYRPRDLSNPAPVQANQSPVADPLIELPAPTTFSDPVHVHSIEHGGVDLIGTPILTPSHTLTPGVYEWISIVGAGVTFEPGVYVIRGANPVTGISLSLIDASVQADGVMFYLTNTNSYSPISGSPDAVDGDTSPPDLALLDVVPSVLITGLLFGSRLTAVNDSNSPYDGMLLYQRRWDRRPLIIAMTNLLGGLTIEGNIYAKWSHAILVGRGNFRSAFAVGSLRVVPVTTITLDPVDPLPPAYDVYLVE